MRKVTLLGASFDTGNMGVSALAASLVKLVKEINPAAHISLFIGERSVRRKKIQMAERFVDVDVINYRLSPKSSIGEHLLCLLLIALMYRIVPSHKIKQIILQTNWRLKSLALSDFVGDIRGGDSFSDIYGIRSFILGSIPSIITLLIGKKLVLLPQTYGPYKSLISHIIARYILSRAYIILSRDKESIDLVKKLLGKIQNKQILFCPDVAFALDSHTPKNGVIPPFANSGEDHPVIGFNINGLLYNGGYTRNNMFNLKLDYKSFVHKLSEAILKDTHANLLLIPHTFAAHGHVESDPDACMEVFNALSPLYRGRIQIIAGEYDQHAIKGIIGGCNFFIGSRMHACIAALSQKIPTAAVAYSKKFKGVFNSIDVGNLVIDAREAETREAVNMIIAMFEDRAQIGKILKVQIDAARKQQMKIFQAIITHAS